jgi:DNA replication and repair protein RecF
MIIKNIIIKNFRNIEEIYWEPNKKNSIILGDNGEGKTNLLEAIYLLFTLRPLRTGKDYRPLLKKKENYFSIKANIVLNDKTDEIFISYSNGKKKLIINKKEVKPKEFLQNHTILFFSPDQSTLLVESPEMRRRLVDRFIFALSPEYYDSLKKFKSILKKRNALLKQTTDKKLIYSLDYSLAPFAFKVSKERREFINLIKPYFENEWKYLKPEVSNLTVGYNSGKKLYNSPESFLKKLHQKIDTDINRNITTFGPHREDISFTINDGIGLKNYLSHGERKAAALAFNLGFAKLLRKKINFHPLFLLDDLSSELDNKTYTRVIENLMDLDSQIIITTLNNNNSDFKMKKGCLKIF